MKKKISTIVSVILILITLFSFKLIENSTWKNDLVHSRLGFTITHLGISDAYGSFSSFESKITSSKPDFSDASIELTADANTINTGNEMRDGHLKGTDFFDVAKYPKITIKSTSFKKIKDKNYKFTGDLTFHGKTKSVTLDAIYNGTTTNPMSKKEMAGFKVSGKIKRSDFDFGAGMPSTMLSDEVTIIADFEFAKE